MKLCSSPNCENKIKNSYTFCYECNKDNHSICSDTIYSPDGAYTPLQGYKKESIPKTLRNCLWINYYADARTGKCQCCKRENISIDNYHVGHIIAECNHGTTTLDNLIPLCMLCNTSIQKQNVNDFIKKYNIHFGL
jgi:5-methylcytosine-specific restriction endonuclease McrA